MTKFIDFNDLGRGTVVDNEYKDQGVTISAIGGSNKAMIFDSAKPTGGDSDLKTDNLKKVLIISEDGKSNDPDDNGGGGTLRFVFDEPASVKSLTFLDIEETAKVKFYDADNNLIKTVDIAATGNNGQREVEFDVDGASRMDVQLAGSGAIDNLAFEDTFNPDFEPTSREDLVSLWEFSENGAHTAKDTAGDISNAQLKNGAFMENNELQLDGHNDFALVKPAEEHQLDEGKIELVFNQDQHVGSSPDTLVSRDSSGFDDGGHFTLSVTKDGAVSVRHQTDKDSLFFETEKKFFEPGDDVRVSYSWDEGGAGGKFIVNNLSTGKTFEEDVPNTLTMDMGPNFNEPWTIGAGQQVSDNNSANHLREFFDGEISYVAIYDNATPGVADNTAPDARDDSSMTLEGEAIIIDLLANDFDADGDTLTVTNVSVPAGQGTVVDNGDGTATFTPADGFTGTAMVSYDITDGNGGRDWAKHFVEVKEVVDPVGDGIVSNDNDGEVIDTAYDGDPDGDFIDNGDALLPGEAPQDDIVDANGGDDTITSGLGDDDVYAGSGDDSVDGGTGNDLIFGDSNLPGGTNGPVNITIVGDGAGFTNGVFVYEIDVATGTISNIQTLTDDHEASLGETFSVNVAPGTVIGVGILSPQGTFFSSGYGPNLDLNPDGILHTVGLSENPDGSVTIGFEDLLNGGDNDFDDVEVQIDLGSSGATFDNAHFDYSSTPGVVDDGPDGNDVLDGAEGDDTIFGEGGNDTLTGGDGADVLDGGADADVIFAGAGDVVDGGDGGFDADPAQNTDDDILDLTGQGPFRIEDRTPDANGNGFNGTIVFVNPDGSPTGATLTFTEIEEVRGEEVNTGPVANDDSATTQEDVAVTIPVLTNDTDADGDTLTITEATVPAEQGTVTIDGGNLVFTPAPNFNGDAQISYTISDGEDTDSAVVDVTVTHVNDGPVASDDTATTQEDTAVTIDVLGNDIDVDGDPLTITEATVPAAQGSVEIVGNQLVFTPADNFNGEAQISYTISDGNGGTDSATATVTVEAVNDAPIVCPDLYFVTEDEGAGDLDGNVITNPSDNNAGLDVDPDGTPLTIFAINGDENAVGQEVAGSAGGIFKLNPDGSFDFSADGDFEFLAPGETQNTVIEYTATDGNGGFGTATLTITVQGINDAPDAVNDAATMDEDTTIIIDALANDTDPEDDPLTITGASVPAAQGNVEVVGNQLVFTPAPDFFGEATISYAIEDGNGGTDTAEAVVTVENVNDDPVAVDDIADTMEDEPVVVDLIGNDTDVDGDTLTIGTVSVPPEQGSVVDNGDGTVTFTPAPNFNGPATISYTVVDGNGGEDDGIATVNVGEVNDGPTAVDDADTTPEDTPITIDVTGNDTDPDGDTLTVTGATVPAEQGSVVDNGDGTLTFTPAPNFNGTATISYSITDGNGGTSSAEVVVDVTPVNDDPVAVDDIETTMEDTPVVVDLIGNDTDVDGDTLTIGTVSVPPEQGSVVDNGDGTVTFTPALNFNGPATITYTVVDGQGGEDEGEAVVSVGAVNDGPVANDDTASTDEDTPVVVDLTGNDTDADGDPLTVIDVSVPAEQGDVTDNGDGTVTFTPAPGFSGEATITYTISDGNGGTDTGQAVVTVNDVNDAPDAVDDNVDVPAFTGGNPVLIDALFNDSDLDGDDLTIINAVLTGGEGQVAIVGNEVQYTPAADYEGPVTIDYTIEDEDGLTDTATITLNVRDGIVSGTDDGELIDEDYLGDPGGDVVDGDDNIFSNDPNDRDDDIIVAGGGNDTIEAGNGADDITAGTGDDQVHGGAGDDSIEGNDGMDTIAGGAGDDVIDGGADDDSIRGGDGSDTIFGGEGSDSIVSSDPDNDLLIDAGYPGLFTGEEGTPAAENERDFVDGGAGNDTIRTGDDRDTIIGGTGNDVIDGGIDDDEIEGNEGADRIVGGEGSDLIDGGDGNDTIFAGNDPDLGLDFLNIEDESNTNPLSPDLRPDNGIDTVFGGDGDDSIFGADDADLLFGEDGDDFIDGEIDNDSIEGGEGNDTLLGGEGRDTILGGAGNDEIEGGLDADSLVGGDGDDTITGGNGKDTIEGGIGDDVLDGGTGEDSIEGGAGHDDISGSTGNDTLLGGDGRDTIAGGDGDDFIDGGFNPDEIDGGDGDDTIFGGNGKDTILGGDGNDVIDSGTGEDSIDGGEGNDDITASTGDDTVLGGGGNDTIDADDGDDLIEGGDGDDLIKAGEGNDTITGGEGQDTIFGEGGDDSITGGLNPDLIDGGDGNDTIDGGNGKDTLLGGDGNDVIDGGTGEDSIDGGAGNDDITGSTGNDTITGGAGNDTIDSGGGSDDLSGGDDRDLFINVSQGDVIDGNEGGDDFDVLDLTGSAEPGGSLTVEFDPLNAENGTVTYRDNTGAVTGTLDFVNIENVIPCFTPGTLIATPTGERRVEDLEVGDRVITRDNGIQEIRWIGKRTLTGAELSAAPHLQPVLIRAGALGAGLPERDMMVSPQHRVLMANDRTALYFDEREVLVAAKHLTGLDGVDIVDASETTYIHVMFDHHEVILSDGAWTESFQPGDMTLNGMSDETREELFAIFPELRTEAGISAYAAARRSLKKLEAALLVS